MTDGAFVGISIDREPVLCSHAIPCLARRPNVAAVIS